VVQRYIEYLSAKIDASGGNAGSIAPSPTGTPIKTIGHPPRPRRYNECTGKVSDVIFDCFGDFEGFVMACCCSDTCVFNSSEKAIGELVLKALSHRWTITVSYEGFEKKICEIRVVA
jgi:hypothetical protein